MPYLINNYDGSTRLALADGVIDNSTSLNLVGKNVSDFGQAQNENFVYLLENFADSTPPRNPVTGQLWYDVSGAGLNYYNSARWVPLNQLNTDPNSVEPNALFYNTLTNQVFVYNATTSTLVGPETVPGFGITKLSSVSLLDNLFPSQVHPVIEIIVANEIVGVISTTSFFVNSSNSIPGISYVNRGITLKYPNSNNFPLFGTSVYSNLATTATNVGGGSTGSVVYQNSTGTTTHLNIASAGSMLISTGSAPAWQLPNNISVNTATNLAGPNSNAVGAMPYQNASGSTKFVSLSPTLGSLLTSGVISPVWVSTSSITVANSINASHATTSSYATTSTYTDSFNTATLVSHSVYTDSFNTATLVSHSVYTDSFNTATLVTYSVFSEVAGDALNFNTGTLVAEAVYADSFNTATLVSLAANATHASNASTSTYAATAIHAISAETVPWSGVTAPPSFSYLPVGCVIMWYGDPLEIPVGWQICDGTNRTPNLVGRFAVGVGFNGGPFNLGDTGGSSDAIVPSHSHDINISHRLTDPGHHHASNYDNRTPGSIDSPGAGSEIGGSGYDWTFPTTTSPTNIDLTIDASIVAQGENPTNANLPPYYAIYYIMKIFP
jgi:hypothetical protein